MITVSNVTKSYSVQGSSMKVLDDISICINKGEIVSIIGPSGCGKSTLLKMIAGLITTSSGQIQNQLDQSSIVFQNSTLLPWKSVSENIGFSSEITGKKIDHDFLLRLVGLESFKDFYPAQLSGGMQQRVNLARALALNSDLLLMDEPFGALDELTKHQLQLEILNIWNKFKNTIVFITHSIEEAVFLSDRVIILSDSPASLVEVVSIPLSRPRKTSTRDMQEYRDLVKCIREKIHS